MNLCDGYMYVWEGAGEEWREGESESPTAAADSYSCKSELAFQHAYIFELDSGLFLAAVIAECTLQSNKQQWYDFQAIRKCYHSISVHSNFSCMYFCSPSYSSGHTSKLFGLQPYSSSYNYDNTYQAFCSWKHVQLVGPVPYLSCTTAKLYIIL